MIETNEVVLDYARFLTWIVMEDTLSGRINGLSASLMSAVLLCERREKAKLGDFSKWNCDLSRCSVVSACRCSSTTATRPCGGCPTRRGKVGCSTCLWMEFVVCCGFRRLFGRSSSNCWPITTTRWRISVLWMIGEDFDAKTSASGFLHDDVVPRRRVRCVVASGWWCPDLLVRRPWRKSGATDLCETASGDNLQDDRTDQVRWSSFLWSPLYSCLPLLVLHSKVLSCLWAHDGAVAVEEEAVVVCT